MENEIRKALQKNVRVQRFGFRLELWLLCFDLGLYMYKPSMFMACAVVIIAACTAACHTYYKRAREDLEDFERIVQLMQTIRGNHGS